MRKFIDALKSIDPMLAVAFTMTFAVAFMLGQHTTAKDASEVEVAYHNPYKSLALDGCVTDYECNIAQLPDDQNGRFVSTDDPTFFPDSVPVIEPVDCETGDKECEKANKLNAGKPASYPAICEPYILD